MAIRAPDGANKKYRKTGATNYVGPVKVQPPFINPMIEILVAAKGSFLLFSSSCQFYNIAFFEMSN